MVDTLNFLVSHLSILPPINTMVSPVDRHIHVVHGIFLHLYSIIRLSYHPANIRQG